VNAETRRALEESDRGENVRAFSSPAENVQTPESGMNTIRQQILSVVFQVR